MTATPSPRPRFASLLLRRILIAVGLFVAVGLLAWLLPSAPWSRQAPQRSRPLEARIELAAGDVTVGYGAEDKPAVSGAAVLENALLKTGAGARALARLSDGSAIFMRDGSELLLGAEAIALRRGEVWVDAPPSERQTLVYQAGAAAVSAESAGLSIKNIDGLITVYVARGLATVSTAAGRVEVQAGEQAQAQGEDAPVVSPVSFWVDWTGGMGDHRMVSQVAGAGSGRIYGVDLGGPAGTPPRELELSRQAVRAVIRDGLAETEVDQSFFNPGQNAVEGWYWFTVPAGASVTSFDLETNGVLIPGELIERKEASRQYAVAARTGNDPALLEWIDAGTYRARIFPIAAGGTRRVVLRYVQLLPMSDGKLSYLYPLQSDPPQRVGEFSLSVDLGEQGSQMELTTLAEARVEAGGRRVTMRRSGYAPRADFLLEARLRREPAALRVSRFGTGGETADYVMVRYAPQIDWDAVPKQAADVVLVVDSSAASDDATRQLKVLSAEAVLRALSAEDHFAMVSLDVRATVLHPEAQLAPASDENIAAALEKLNDHASGGATDLAAMFDVALGRLHAAEQPAVIYIGDGLATSGALSGEQMAERLRRALSTSRARFFTVAVGGDSDHALLAELARVGGGHSFRVDASEETTERALRLASAVKTPTLTEFSLDLGAGLDEVFLSATGKVGRGDEVLVLARSHHPIPREVEVTGRLAGKPYKQAHQVERDRSVLASFVPRLWAAEKMRRLLGRSPDPERERGRIVKLGVDYGLMTPFTSFLALESEAAYHQQGIPRRHSPLRGQRLSSLNPSSERQLVESLAGLAVAATGLGCHGLSEEAAPMPAQQVDMAMRAAEMEVQAEPMAAPPPASPAAPSVAADGYEAKKSIRAKASAPVGGMAQLKDEAMAFGDGDKAGGARRQPRRNDSPRDANIAPARACSDVSRRPLAQRRLLWQKRFRSARGPAELLGRYQMARGACELSDWHSEAMFLRLLAAQVRSEASASYLLNALRHEPTMQRYLARVVMRRAVDSAVVQAVERILLGNAVDWAAVDRALAALPNGEARIARLREELARAPEDPAGVIRMVRLLAEVDRLEEALLHGERLRERGLMTPQLARQLGDVLARHGMAEEAVRVYSEIVEFDPSNAASRRMLGDIYLAHGWHAEAYRQYRTLSEASQQSALDLLRLAAAAAGEQRIDEALRIERQVAEDQGRPGPQDPRRWARLASAARIAGMLASVPSAAKGEDPKAVTAALERKLKQLQLFRGPSTLVLLTWEDLQSQVELSTEAGGTEVAVGEATDASPVGLSAVLLSAADLEELDLVARLRSAPRERAVSLRLHTVRWDGRAFAVEVKQHELAPLEVRAAL